VDYHYATSAPGIYTLVNSDFPMKFGYTSNGVRGSTPTRFDKATTTMLRYCAMGYLFFSGWCPQEVYCVIKYDYTTV